jgi:hypothetical protein
MTATSATNSAHPHSGTTMPPRRFAVKNGMMMTDVRPRGRKEYQVTDAAR